MKKQQVAKADTKVLKKNYKKTRDFVVSGGSLYNSDKLLSRLAKQIDEGVGNNPTQQFFKDYEKAIFTLGFDTHVPVAESVKEEYKHFLVEIIRNIECEYDCNNSIEKSLAEIIALSHIRIIYLSKVFNNFTAGDKIISKEKTDYYNMVGRELDRAHRQLARSILTLKQIKVPSLSFKINAKTTFIAQNQQINTNGKQNEINEHQ